VIIILRKGVSQRQVRHVAAKVRELGLKPVISTGVERTIVAVIGDEGKLRLQPLEAYPGVERVMPVQKPYKMVSREFRSRSTIVRLGKGADIGGRRVTVISGPCTIENEAGLAAIARAVKKSGARILRGGAFKPRTSPYDFQGLGEEGLRILARVGKAEGILTVTEVMDIRDVPAVEKHVDIMQIGARNMQNFNLLKELGKTRKAVILKRGMSNTVREFLMAAEYLYAHGNHRVILCERGIRTFEDSTRFTLDLSAVAVIKTLSHLPVIVDPSHAAGKRAFVPALTRAAVAAGADGIMVEVHDKPECAVCDGPQALLPKTFEELMKELKKIAAAIGRTV